MWIISSVEAAGFAARGQPIEWLAHSLVQENTSDYRRAQVDRKVESLEITLRDLTHTHAQQSIGAGYISQLWDDTTEMRRAARREGRDADDPRSLLDFVYLSSLGAAMGDNVDWFHDGCVPDVEQFSQAIVQLNKVRRKAAHNRPISDGDLRCVREASALVMAPIGHAHPELAQDFLVDRWEQRVDEVFASMQRDSGARQVPDRGVVPELTRYSAAVAALRATLAAIEVAIDEMDSVVVPDARRELHDLANAALHRWRQALAEMLTVAGNPSLNAADAEDAADALRAALVEVGELRARIQSVRLGTDTAQSDGA